MAVDSKRRHHNRSRSGGNPPQRDRAFLLNFRMRETDSEREARRAREGRRSSRFGSPGQLAEGLQHGNAALRPRDCRHDHDSGRPAAFVAADQKQRFCRWSQSGDTNAPRALPEVGGHTREGGQLSTSAKRSRTKGRTMHFDFNRVEDRGIAVVTCAARACSAEVLVRVRALGRQRSRQARRPAAAVDAQLCTGECSYIESCGAQLAFVLAFPSSASRRLSPSESTLQASVSRSDYSISTNCNRGS